MRAPNRADAEKASANYKDKGKAKSVDGIHEGITSHYAEGVNVKGVEWRRHSRFRSESIPHVNRFHNNNLEVQHSPRTCLGSKILCLNSTLLMEGVWMLGKENGSSQNPKW